MNNKDVSVGRWLVGAMARLSLPRVSNVIPMLLRFIDIAESRKKVRRLLKKVFAPAIIAALYTGNHIMWSSGFHFFGA